MAVATPYAVTTTSENPLAGSFPLNHARILYVNRLAQALTLTDTQATGTVSNAVKPNTWEKWRFTGDNTLTATFATGFEMDSICLGSHNLQGATIRFSYVSAGTTVNIATRIPTTNAPIFIHIPNAIPVTSVSIEVTATGAREVGFASVGVALQMQRPFFNGHVPITDGDVTQYYSNRTESGEIIGQQIRRQGFETSAEWQNIDDTWYRTFFAPFKQAAKLRPFFFAWNLLEYPLDVGFCRISQDISAPMQNGTVTKRSISMNLLGAD